jgi:molecular chaperone DnaK (HSP70)
MPGRFAVDFGTSNTVVAVWDETRREGMPLFVPEFSRYTRQGADEVPVIPSLIHYAPDRRRWIGAPVLDQGLYHSSRTFRWMKRYISHRSPIRIRLDDREVTYTEAGKDFLTSVMIYAGQEVGIQDEEVALSVPVEAYEHYEDWLAESARAAGMTRVRLIDEPSAAALGYGAHIQPGSVYLIFDFGGGTLHAAVVLIDDSENQRGGRRCRVLGKAGRDIGGTVIDQWIFQEVLKRSHKHDSDDDIRRISSSLLVESERVKEQLSSAERADLSVINPDTGAVIAAEFTRASFEELLEAHDLYAEIDHTVRGALNLARERGYNEDRIAAALMVGGSSQIPSVQRTLRQIFGKERVLFHRPLDAVARGAAAFIAGVDFYDHIQHDYAIRSINPGKGGYDLRVIVPRGTPYPTLEPVARLHVKATYEGQSRLGIQIYEMGEQRARVGSVELVFDPTGAARIMNVSADEQERRESFWMNEGNPTFLPAEPQASPGEARFEVEFNIDGNKRLLITARDLLTGRLTHRDYPVVKLT